MGRRPFVVLLFFFNDTATTEIYTLPLLDALPILQSHNLLDDDRVLLDSRGSKGSQNTSDKPRRSALAVRSSDIPKHPEAYEKHASGDWLS